MPDRRFRTYFFKVETGRCPVSFQEMLLRINALALHARVRDVMGSPVRLDTLDVSQAANGVLFGDMERVQMDNFPRRAKTREESRELELDEDEGLGHSSAFSYDARQKILALQGNLTGVGATRFAEYVRAMMTATVQPLLLDFQIVMLPANEANRAFQRDAEFRKITFSVTNPDAVGESLNHLDPNAPIISTMLRSASRDLPGSKLTITLSAAHSTEDLDPAPVKRILRLLRRAHGAGAPVARLVAKGAFGGEDAELNFLPSKMCIDDVVQTRRGSLPFRDRKAALVRARAECAPRLNGMFRRDQIVIEL